MTVPCTPPTKQAKRPWWQLGALTVMLLAAIALVAPILRKPRARAIDTKMETGRQLTFVLIAPTGKPDTAFLGAVRRGRDAMRAYASNNGYYFSTIGISDDWSVPRGLALLDRFGAFDEVVVGRNWFNLGIDRFISSLGAVPGVPQLVITTQYINVDTLPFIKGALEVPLRLIGHQNIINWATRRFPFRPSQLDSLGGD